MAGPACGVPSTDTATRPNLVRNGSFEEPASPRPGLVGTFSSIPGWNESTGHGIEIQNGLYPAPAGGGFQYVELDAAAPSSIFQDVPTEPGTRYRLSFHYTAHPNTPAAVNLFDVTFGGTTMAVAPPWSAAVAWQSATLDMIATARTTQLTFTDAVTNDDHRGTGAFIDLVEVHRLD